MVKNEIYKVNITDTNNLGAGIAKIDGMAVFVDGAVTGDELEIKIIKVAKDYGVARIEKIISPSPYRIESDCAISKRCGGCTFRHVSFDFEQRLKADYVRSAFQKQRLDVSVGIPVSDGRIDGYRNKVQYPVGEDGAVGYYARRSHDIVKCDGCSLADPRFNDILPAVTEYIRKSGARGIVRHIYMRRAFGTGDIMLCLVCRDDTLPQKELLVKLATDACRDVKSIVLNVNPDDTNVILGKRCITLWGSDTIKDELCGLTFDISPLSFYQVNHGVTELLYADAVKRIARSGPKKLLDLYCGIGTIGLVAAKSIPSLFVVGAEIVPAAVENAKLNADANGIADAEFVCADAGDVAVGDFDCVVVDPPRKGLGIGTVRKLCDAGVRRIVYVSCNVDTLARDAAVFVENGYEQEDVALYNMFPRTGSVECLTAFTKRTVASE